MKRFKDGSVYVTTQRTAKKWKALLIVSEAMIWAAAGSFILAVYLASQNPETEIAGPAVLIAILLLACVGVLRIYIKWGSWWHHG
jgi:hypothetical protein